MVKNLVEKVLLQITKDAPNTSITQEIQGFRSSVPGNRDRDQICISYATPLNSGNVTKMAFYYLVS